MMKNTMKGYIITDIVPGDIDYDGVYDHLLFGTTMDAYMTDINTGNIVMDISGIGMITDIKFVNDFNGDRKKDILITTTAQDTASIYCYSSTGEKLWSYRPVTYVFSDMGWTENGLRSWAILPLNDSVVISSWSQIRMFSPDGEVKWFTNLTNDVWVLNKSSDYNGDSVNDILFGTQNGYAGIISGKDCKVILNVKVTTTYILNSNAPPGQPKNSIDMSVWSVEEMGDITGDGIPEILIGGEDSLVYAMDGSNGNIIWKYKAFKYTRATSVESSFLSNRFKNIEATVIDDVSGDGVKDVFLTSYFREDSYHSATIVIKILSGDDGTYPDDYTDENNPGEKSEVEENREIFSYTGTSDNAILPFRHISFTGGKTPYVIVPTHNGILRKNVTGEEKSEVIYNDGLYLKTSGYYQIIPVGDVNADGENEFIISYGSMGIGLINEKGKNLWSIYVPQGEDVMEFDDVNDDGIKDALILVKSYPYYIPQEYINIINVYTGIAVVDGKNGRLIWKNMLDVNDVEMYPYSKIVYTDDVNKDGVKDILALRQYGINDLTQMPSNITLWYDSAEITMFDGRSGEILWQTPFSNKTFRDDSLNVSEKYSWGNLIHKRVVGMSFIGDTDGDGVRDILIASDEWGMGVFSGGTGREIRHYMNSQTARNMGNSVT